VFLILSLKCQGQHIPTVWNPGMNPDGLCACSYKDRLDNPHLRSADRKLSKISFLIFQTGNQVDYKER